MGILGALFSGVSGLNVFSSSIEVIGNNIANANTAGFKGSRAEFSDILARSLTGSTSGGQIGRGVQLSAVSTFFTQGSFENTPNATDLAIDGAGFFQVRNNDGLFFTRAGGFSVNAAGLMVNSRGDRVQGVRLDSAGNPSSTVQDLNLTATNSPPKTTDNVNFVANLNAADPALGTRGTATGGSTVTDRFQFLTGTNDVIRFDVGGAALSASLITDGGLVSGALNSGAAVATAIKSALEAANLTADTYTVAYNTLTKKFDITNDTTNATTLTLLHSDALSTLSRDLGFSTAANDVVAAGITASSDNQVQFNVVTGRNTFTISLDNDFYVASQTATVAAGAYTADGLSAAIEKAINDSDAALALDRIRSVRVTYDSTSNPNKFQIISQTTGAERVVDIPSDSNSFTIPSSRIRVTETSLGVLGITNLGQDETFAITQGLNDKIIVDKFVVNAGNKDIVVDLGAGNVTVDLLANAPGVLTSGVAHSAGQIALAIKTAFENQNPGADTYTVTFSNATRKFTIKNDTGNTNPINIKWSDAATTAEGLLAFNATDSGAIAAGGTDLSDNTTVLREFSLITNGGLVNGAISNPLQISAAIKATLEVADAGATYTVVFNSATDKFTITKGAGGADVTLSWTDAVATATATLGFATTADDSFTAAGAGSAVSDNALTTVFANARALNLDGTGGFDVTDPANLTSANFSTSLTLFDSLGSAHSISIFFRKIGENFWEYNGTMQGTELQGPTADTAGEQVLYGRLVFTEKGALDIEEKFLGPNNPDGTTNAPDANGLLFPRANRFNFSGGALQDQLVNFDFGTAILTDSALTGGLDGVTQFSGSSAVLNQQQDGFTTGTLQAISVGRNGNITGQFTNGQTRNLARIILANFNAPNKLNVQGASLFSETQDSGQPILGQATTAGFGTILANSVELSNVDIADQFVQLIQNQQGFQANARIISTTEELLDEIVNLVR
ncbi:MAG: flagellar hook-basal body complex protein [bacterium]